MPYEIDAGKCISCGTCEQFCPVCAISNDQFNILHIDHSICTECGDCEIKCPNDAIEFY